VPVCKSCGDSFPSWARIEGKPRNLSRRRYCLVCSPFGERAKNRRTPPKEKRCGRCKLVKPAAAFYRRRGVQLQTRCKDCSRIEAVERQQALKRRAVEYKGGQCELCGYRRCVAALDFHHTDPTQKDFAISRLGSKVWSEAIARELDKCQLVCANCHREAHDTK